MSENLKQKIEALIQEGYSKEEILSEANNQTNQSSEKLVFNRKREDVLSKMAVFLVSGTVTWFLLALITFVVFDLFGYPNETGSIATAIIVTVLSIFIGYKIASKVTYRNSIQNIINLGILPYLAELILPSVLTYLLLLFAEEKDSWTSEEATVPFSLIFFALVILEWFRRHKDKSSNSYLKYLYVVIMLIVFAFGLWYVTELAD
jgi:hypothetical protein